MKVVTEVSGERRTRVELTDREIALVTNALFVVNESEATEGNDSLWGEFDSLRIKLDIEDIDRE